MVAPGPHEFSIMTTHVTTGSYLHDDFNYTDAHCVRYDRDGYVFLDHFLSDEGLQRCLQQCDRMLGQLHPDRGPETMISAHQQEKWIFDLACEPKLLDIIEKHIGPNIVLWSTHMLCKAPHSGEVVPWHQDSPYWNVKGHFGPGLWIPFDDIDQNNGAMAVIPGWHKKGVLPRRNSGLDQFTEEIEPSSLPDDVDAAKVEYKLRAGQAAIHNVLIPHCSPPNRSDRWRRVLVLRYIAADGEFNRKTYEDYRTGAPFERQFLLVRGDDVAQKGLPRSPFS